MKIKSFICAFIIFTAAVLNVDAQTDSASVWAVDFVKTKNGRQADYLKFIEQNWAKARLFMKEKGIVASYQVLSLPASSQAEWDVLLMTEYTNQTGFDRREEIFNEYRRNSPPNNSASLIKVREISEIKYNRNFSRPISSELGKAMLNAQTTDAETAAVRVPLENYLQGHATGDPDFMRRAFHADGNLIFIRDGKYATRTFAEYIGGMNGKPAPDEDKRRRWIESVDAVGNAAVGKIILDYPSGKFVDYMTLLKINGEWKIVNKSFYVEPNAPGRK